MTSGPTAEMPFLDHLEELRHRLMWSAGALLLGVVGALVIVMRPELDVIGWLAAPVMPFLPEGKLVVTHPLDPFSISLKVAFAVGLVGALPVIGYHLWSFLAPALHPHEKRLMVPVLLGATMLFASGVFVAWRFVLPIIFEVLVGMQSASLQPLFTARDVFGFMVTTCLAFGAISQLPIVVLGLTALGLVTPAAMMRFRRYAMAASVLLSAIVTPGDLLIMTILMAVPLYLLYEVSIIISWLVHRRRIRRIGVAAVVLLLGGGMPMRLDAQPPRPRPVQPRPDQPVPGAAPGTILPDPRVGPQGRSDPQGRRGADATPAARGAGATLIDWAPDDSVIRALLARRGYTAVRYQAGQVRFEATGRLMTLLRDSTARAAVQRDSTLLVADRIAYSDSLKRVDASGDTIVMRDPSRGDDIIGHRELVYDVERREGRTRDFSTIAKAGEDWKVMAHQAAFASDSVADRNTVYGRNGVITSCLDSVPHYHFLAKELKRVGGSTLVARPAILYVQDVPVMWLPFIFQDIRSGRRSGIIPPRLGFAELVRNSPTYRRTVENLGYYFAINDYIDAQVSMDWRSSARATAQDPGWTRFNGEIRYRWLDRFTSGTLALSQNTLSTGSQNTAISWSHAQEFSSRTRINTNLNYVTSTQIQRQTIINPLAAVATIASQMNLVRQQGPFSVNLGGTRRQYPGRDQVDQDFPSLNIASKPLELGKWFVLNPSLQFGQRNSYNLDATGDFAYRYLQTASGLDSVRLKRNTGTTTLAIGTPFKIFDFQVQSGIRFNQQLFDYPQIITLRDVQDSSVRVDRVYQRTYESSLDADISIGLPQFLQGTWNLTPSVTASNVDPGGFAVRTFRSNGAWVTQRKRLSYGLGVSPTIYALFPGFGPVQRFRHAISPTVSYSYSPEASVPDAFLAATGRTRAGYLGSLAQNRVSLGLTTNIEAKLRVPEDSADLSTDGGKKVKVATIQFTGIAYDFERRRATGKTGFATDRFGYTFRSDLLPGFDLGVDYSLFQGDLLSDTASFKPYREAVRASFNLDANSSLVQAIARLLGISIGASRQGATPTMNPSPMGGGLISAAGSLNGMGATTGTRTRGGIQEIPTGQGFTAAFTVSSQRQRPPVGGRIVDFDPTLQCQALLGFPQYDTCVFQAERSAATQVAQTAGPSGATFFRVPPTTSVGIRTTFNLTPRWAGSWSTTYDVVRREFASQVVSLQRELHDWRAVFGFTQAPNGNFAFTFFISLKAQPEIKLDYDRQTFRPPGAGLRTP
ncbi:MAG: twin-arginine translocase subunit TatC [Gemmatimonadetes bacterium]|nr:twin-arginine translocase subunit TatC [Gemmatimonadota bacterium]MBM4190893.1 twin-arginine translocase subunit TatC [Gemmatimonadota bacterium]